MSRSIWTMIVVPPREHVLDTRAFEFTPQRLRIIISITLLVSAIGLSLPVVLLFMDFPPEADRLEQMATDEQATRISQEIDEARRMLERYNSETRERERGIEQLHQRYSALQALVAGQEDIARAHREILMERTFFERLSDMLYGLTSGIIASVLATLVYIRPRFRIGDGNRADDMRP